MRAYTRKCKREIKRAAVWLTLIHECCVFFDPGGTDIIACFAGHNCTGGVYRGEIQCRMLGMAVECWNDDGNLAL